MKFFKILSAVVLCTISAPSMAGELRVYHDLQGISLSADTFEKVARLSFARRRWEVVSGSGAEVVGRLVRKGQPYKVAMTLQGDQVVIAYVAGFGADRDNYLRNLALDFETELGKACLRKHRDLPL